MISDYLFIGTGVAAICLGVYLALRGLRRSRRQYWVEGFLWALLGSGLLVQAFAPHLKIERNRFIVSYQLDAEGAFAPHKIVERERRMQLLSATLTLCAALGLGVCYRTYLVRSTHSRIAAPAKGRDSSDCSRGNSH
jgi:hypothetical protein